ncbi:MAG: adenosylmethionine--8-amino-7-oxononanoate transaminase [Candidatus Omnitrophica bacterium]|nr:adenosylmethionine--8-amino-7-oxononanoate transaminase [Candidatus Omnitrophota bacterium]
MNYFITGTDTDVGKTIVTYVLGLLLQEQGHNVGVMKPVQCAGEDAEFLVNALNIKDAFHNVNPFYTEEPLSPHLAFHRAKKTINISQILKSYQILSECHDLMLVEGAGGLMVPLKKNYLVADLIRDLDLDVIVVSRLGLGAINHALLTIRQAQDYGLNVKGVVFSEANNCKKGLAESNNPEAIEEYGGVPVLGKVPFMKNLSRTQVIQKCKDKINVRALLKKPSQQKTKQLVKDDQQYVWHPFTQMKDWMNDEPLIIEKGQGSYLIDTEGRRYLDGVSSLWVNVHGHHHRDIDHAVKSQVNHLAHSTLLGLSNPPAIELAKELVKITPKGLDKVFYSDSGSTAVEIALKLAYQYWQNIGQPKKINIVHLANSYHGDTLGSVSVGGIDLFHKVYRHLRFQTIKLDFPDCYRNQDVDQALDNLEQLFQQRHTEIAAFVVEPIVQGAAGMIMWPKGVLKRMADVCRKYDVLFITDEVATGFGRTGSMFACEHEDVQPDFLCLAKGITGGYLPLAATLTTKRVFDGFLFNYKDLKTFFHGHTYTGNPLACAAALANLKIFKKERTLTKLAPKIKYLDKSLKMFYNLPHVGDVRQRGFMVGIELVQNKSSKTPYPYEWQMGAKVCQKVRERGVILRPLGNVIVLMPPLSISKEELKELLDVTYWALELITGE